MKPIQFSLKSSKSSSLSKMNQEKIATFAFGNTTKSKYQAEKEKKEEREKKELEEAMKLYKDFEEDSFNFVPKKKIKTSNIFDDSSSQINDNFDENKPPAPPPPAAIRRGKPKKKIDEFLEKIKNEQEKVGNKDEYDSKERKTNIFIINISRSVTEDDLYNFFSKYGTITSVKIKAPKDTDRKTNVAFVNYTKPRFAEIAKAELDGKEFRGLTIRISWGRDQPDSSDNNNCFYLKQLHFQNRNYKGELLDDKMIYVKPPKLEIKRKIIDLLAEYISKCGSVFEERIIQRERNNNDFTFLLHEGSPENQYYRWRVYSLCNGDSFYNWNTEPFQMFINGPKWIPPSYEEMGITQSKYEHMKSQAIMKLTDKEYEVFSDLLLDVDLTRKSIRNAMVYCLEHAEAASEIANIICQNTTTTNTSIPSKVAKIYLISDILYNSSSGVKGASAYRSEFEDRLPDLFEELGKIYRNIDGHLTSVGMKERMMNILKVWHDWGLFPTSYILGLEASVFYDPNIDAIEHSDDLHIEDMNETKLKGECLKCGISIDSTPSELIQKLNRNRSYINRKYENQDKENENEKKKGKEEYDIMKSYEKNEKKTQKIGTWVEMTSDNEDEQQTEIIQTNSEINEESQQKENINTEDDDIDGEPIDNDDIDGEPIDDEDIDGEPL